MKKVYYPMRPCKGKVYRKPKNVTYLYVEADKDNNFVAAAAADGADFLLHIERPSEATEYIASLPDKTWIVTYYIDNWASITNALINTFSHITGIGKNNYVLELTVEERGYTVIDAQQYLMSSLAEAIEDLTDYPYREDAQPVELVFMVSLIWSAIVDTLKREFFCYPSKTPGATALKIWRRFLTEDVFSRGRYTSMIGKAALRQPALHWTPGIYEQAYMYDISASYPSVMSNIRYPLFTKAFIGHPPPDGGRWIATVKINYKCTGKFAPLAITVDDGTNVSPVEIKDTRVTITYIDALTLEYTGTFEITEWIEGIYWMPEDERDLFGSWATAIEVASQDARTKKILKIVSRSLHSKFSQRAYYEHIEIARIDADKVFEMSKSSGKVLELYPLDNGDLAIKQSTRRRSGFKPFNRPDWEALTLAAARFRIYASIDENTIYVHTDSIISTKPRQDLPIGSSFGSWREKESGEAIIAGIGLYAIGSEVGKCGMRIDDWKAREAIARAVEENNQVVETIFHPNLFSTMTAGKSRFTVSVQNYPHAIIKGARAWVTRSPTRLMLIKPTRRIISSGGLEKCLSELRP